MTKKIFQSLCYVEIETVSSCTRQCPWCLFGAYPDFRPSGAHYLDTEIIHRVFRSLKQNGFRGMAALFSINEPLMDERIKSGRLIRDCKKIFQERVLVCLTTNGDLLTPSGAEVLFENRLDLLKISCYSETEYRDMMQLYGYDHRITVCDLSRYRNNEFESNRAGTIEGAATQCSDYTGCSYPYYKAVIGWDGEVRICYNDILQQVTIGNVYYEDFAELLSGERMSELRESILTERQKVKPCCLCNISGDEQKQVLIRRRYLDMLS